jgi:hypothetical protein
MLKIIKSIYFYVCGGKRERAKERGRERERKRER